MSAMGVLYRYSYRSIVKVLYKSLQDIMAIAMLQEYYISTIWIEFVCNNIVIVIYKNYGYSFYATPLQSYIYYYGYNDYMSAIGVVVLQHIPPLIAYSKKWLLVTPDGCSCGPWMRLADQFLWVFVGSYVCMDNRRRQKKLLLHVIKGDIFISLDKESYGLPLGTWEGNAYYKIRQL